MDVRDRSLYTSNTEATQVQPTRLRDAGTVGASSAGSSGLGDDSSRLSEAARKLTQAMQLPDVRQERVAGLQEQIAAGSYQVSSEEVANAILRTLAR